MSARAAAESAIDQSAEHGLQSCAPPLQAELQLLLAELKRLGNNQHQLQQELDSIEQAKSARSPANAVLKKHCYTATDIVHCPGPALTVPAGTHQASVSSDWSEGVLETPVRNVVSGKSTAHVVSCCLRISHPAGVEHPECKHRQHQVFFACLSVGLSVLQSMFMSKFGPTPC